MKETETGMDQRKEKGLLMPGEAKGPEETYSFKNRLENKKAVLPDDIVDFQDYVRLPPHSAWDSP